MAPAFCLQLRTDVRGFDRRPVELKDAVDLHLPGEVLLNAAMRRHTHVRCDGNIIE
jgi:hypothetical protein